MLNYQVFIQSNEELTKVTIQKGKKNKTKKRTLITEQTKIKLDGISIHCVQMNLLAAAVADR